MTFGYQKRDVVRFVVVILPPFGRPVGSFFFGAKALHSSQLKSSASLYSTPFVLTRRIGGYIFEVEGESNLEIVSFCVCVRMRGLVVEWNIASDVRGPLSLFTFGTGAFPCFPRESTEYSTSSVVSSKFK